MNEDDIMSWIDSQPAYDYSTIDISEPTQDTSWFDLGNSSLNDVSASDLYDYLNSIGVDNSSGDSSWMNLISSPSVSDTTMSPSEYLDYTRNPTEEELIDWVGSSDLPMNEKIDYLQRLKESFGIVEPGAYSSSSPVVSPDEELRSGATVSSELNVPWGVKSSTAINAKLNDLLNKQALKQLQAKEAYNNSGLGQAMSGLGLAAMLAKALVGKNQGTTTKSRSNQGQAFAPTYQKAAAPKTKYASGGAVKGKGGLLNVAEALMNVMQAKKAGLIQGEAGGQDDVVDIKAAPGEYVMDAETVSNLGDGNTEEGARKLDEMRQNVRKHKRQGALSQIAPKAKKPEQYVKKGK